MNLLIVDDEVAILQILIESIDWASIGIQKVASAHNASEARRVLAEEEIHILICDIEMPKENGLQLIRWVQQNDPSILCIILTGYPEFSYAQHAVELGVYQFLLKPVVFDELKKVVGDAAKQYEQNRKNEQYRKYGEFFALQAKNAATVEEWIQSLLERFDAASLKSDDKRSFIHSISEYIEAHYNEPIFRNDLEELVHMNGDYMNREFKAATGYSLMEYIQHYRITMGKRLLENTSLSVSEIATQVGYDSSSYFAKLFKKWTGVTPMDFRAGRHENH
jgi:YesN/AraC family two-component response regulator